MSTLTQIARPRPLTTDDIGKMVMLDWEPPSDKGLVIASRGEQDSWTKQYKLTCRIIFPNGGADRPIGTTATPSIYPFSDNPNERLVMDVTPHIIKVVNCGGGGYIYPKDGMYYKELFKQLNDAGLMPTR